MHFCPRYPKLMRNGESASARLSVRMFHLRTIRRLQVKCNIASVNDHAVQTSLRSTYFIWIVYRCIECLKKRKEAAWAASNSSAAERLGSMLVLLLPVSRAEPQSRYRLFWDRISMVFFSLSRQMLGYYLWIGYDVFLLHPFRLCMYSDLLFGRSQ
jgi:hypothetical protein